MKKVILLLVLSIILTGCEAKYRSCLEECCRIGELSKSGKSCDVKTSNMFTPPEKECKNICIEKYK